MEQRSTPHCLSVTIPGNRYFEGRYQVPYLAGEPGGGGWGALVHPRSSARRRPLRVEGLHRAEHCRRLPTRDGCATAVKGSSPIFARKSLRMTGDQLFQVLLALLPSVVVFLTAFYLMRQFLGTRRHEANTQLMAEAKREDRQHVLPLRLQAHERLTLFLERIAPGALVFRVHKHNMTARVLHAELLATVREEYEHNVTQQIYLSERAWQQVRMAKEETLRIINIAAEATPDGASGTALSERVFETAARLTHLPTQQAILVLKEEVRKLF